MLSCGARATRCPLRGTNANGISVSATELEAVTTEALKARTEAPKADWTRPQSEERVGPETVRQYTGKWVRGWTGSPNWLNFGLMYKSQEMGVAQDYPATMALLHRIQRQTGREIRCAAFNLVKGQGTLAYHKDQPNERGLKRQPNIWQLAVVAPPDGQSGLLVDQTYHPYAVGKWTIFDDSRRHAVVNFSQTTERLVLSIQFNE
jgi:hypothetical protein